MAMEPLVQAQGRRASSARRLAAVLATLAAAGAILGQGAPAAWAHASFLGADPTPGSRVESSPQKITLRFSEALNRRLSGASLTDARTGRKVSAREIRAGADDIVLQPGGTVPRGAYQVHWHSVSNDDGHLLGGSFGFGVRVRAAAGGAGATAQSPFQNGAWIRALARIGLYASALLFAGAIGLRALLDRRRRRGDTWIAPAELDGGPAAAHARDARARQHSLISDLGIFAVASAAVSAVADAGVAARGLDPSGLREYLLGSLTGVSRVLIVVALAIALWLARRRPGLAAVAAAYALGFIATAGHANSASPRGAAIASDWIHLCAGALWLGGAAFLLLTWWPGLRRGGRPLRAALTRHVLPAFGRVALPAFFVVVISGTANALIEIGSVADLWSTAYGVTLLVKVALVATIAGLSWLHALRTRPRLLARPDGDSDERLERRMWRALRAEPLLSAAVVLAVGLLVAFPLPPPQLDASNEALAAEVPNCDPCPLPAPRADELPVAGLGGSRVVAAWIRRERGALAGTIRVLDIRGRPARGPIRVPGAASQACGPGCERFRGARAGPALTVTVRDRGRPYTVRLPARWKPAGTDRASALLRRAERTMRALRGVREIERVTSGPGSLAVTRYRLSAPDRYAFRTDAGVQSITIGDRQWQRLPETSAWLESPYPGELPFSTRSWFRWTPYARAVRLLGERGAGSRRVAELALADPSTPVWMRLRIDVSSAHVLSERLVAPARSVLTTYRAFDVPQTVTPPKSAAPDGG